MTDRTPDLSIDSAKELVAQAAAARWGTDYAEQNRDLLDLAARYIANVANNLPATETEPGFFHSPNK